MILSSVRLRNFPEDQQDVFPWTLPLIQQFEQLTFDSPITFFVGDNGSGKSTILEGIAAASSVPIAGSRRLEDDQSLAAAHTLADYLSLRYAQKSHHGFFVRAEDFIGFARKIKSDIAALDKEIMEVKESWTGGDIKLALGAIEGEKSSLIKRYGKDLEEVSHGEGFLTFFNARITGRGLYLIDEPEAALSPQNQLVLLSLILEKAKKTGSQFIIATHSPIIMACPGSKVLSFQKDRIEEVQFQETEHYRITKGILDNPHEFLKELESE